MTTPETPSTTERLILPQDITFDELLEKLVAGNIPVELYGTGSAKTVQHLLGEVCDGESTLTIDAQNVVRRQLSVLMADVICELASGEMYILKEDRQEFKDGRRRVRPLDTSIGEKLKPSEKPEEAAGRALQEELGIREYTQLYEVDRYENTLTPNTYPGLESTYNMHKFVAVIPEHEFKPEGYVEYQPDKTNYYTWELLQPAAEQPDS